MVKPVVTQHHIMHKKKETLQTQHFFIWQTLQRHLFLSVPTFHMLKGWTVTLKVAPQRYELLSFPGMQSKTCYTVWREKELMITQRLVL